MHLDDFDFDLPRERIALHPCEPRDAARLLVIPAAGQFEDRRVADLPALLAPGDLLVFNDTKVILARLAGPSRRRHRRGNPQPRSRGRIMARLAKGARRLRPGDRLAFAEGFAATVGEEHPEGDLTLRFEIEGPAFREMLARYGSMPLPPYIKRPQGGDPRDRGRLPDIFARAEGAVAAPTAGLHFTQFLLDTLSRRGIGWTTLTLHVGPGTFLPVKAARSAGPSDACRMGHPLAGDRRAHRRSQAFGRAGRRD